MKKKYYHDFLKAIILMIILYPAFLNAQITMDNQGKSPVIMKFQKGSQPSVASFFQDYRKAYPLSDENQMKELRVSTDKTGSHYRYDQYYKGIQVLGAQFILHEKNGSIWYANGHLVHGIDLDVNPVITPDKALKLALQDINAETYMWEKPENEAFIKREQNDANATFYPSGELKLTSGNNEMISSNIKLVYRFDIYAQQPLGRYWVDVDAKTGQIVSKLDRIHNGDVPGSGLSLLNGTVPITVDEVNPASFRLHENTTRGAVIKTFDLQNTWGDYDGAIDFTSTTADGPWDATGVNGHYGAEATYDYYFNQHGRNSLDDAGFNLLSYVHYGVNYVNAFWDGSRMTYGDGDVLNFIALVSLDVCGHELTHGVTEFTSNLIYQGESGALNESFSDIFGNLVEFYKEGAPGIGTGDWHIGEDFSSNGIGFRNMANPNELGNPDTFEGDFWASVFGSDNGGVHTNSGVQNFWFYLLVEGGSGTNDNGDAYNVTGIGVEDAADIAYLNNTSFLTQFSNFDDARNNSIACAELLFGDGSQQALSTADAWDAVGVDGITPPPPPVPENDLCANAIALSCGTTIPGYTISATFDADAPYCDFPHTAFGVWYTVEGNGFAMTASMCGGPSYDARMTVYEGSCESLSCVGADDDACGLGSVSVVSWSSTAGTTYYILIHGFDYGYGYFDLTITTDAPPSISVTPDQFNFIVPFQGDSSDQLTIANSAEGCAQLLNWKIIKSELPGPSTTIHPKHGYEGGANKARNISEPLDYSFYIGDKTIDALTKQGFFDKYEIRDELLSIKDQVFSGKAGFYSGLSNAIGQNNDNLIAQIFPYAEISFQSSSDHNIDFSPIRKGYLAPSGPPVLIPGSDENSIPPNRGVLTIGTITHSLSQTIIDGNSIACWYGGVTADNSYWRAFELVDFGISSDFDVTEVEIGVQYAFGGSGTQPITVNLYTSDGGSFPTGTLNLIGTAAYDVPDQSMTMLTLPVIGTAPAGSELVVEIQSPDGLANSNGFFIGSNNLGQTGPSYLSSIVCGIPTPIKLDDIGFPYTHFVMNVTGSYELLCPWLSVSQSSGIIAGGNSDDVTVSVDASGLALGTYQCEFTVISNASNASQVVVPVTMTVADLTPPVITVAAPITLWPPDHSYQTIYTSQLVHGIVDDIDGNIPLSAVVIDSVSCDEPDDAPGMGDGNTKKDIVISNGCKSLKLRRERNDYGNGRVYKVYVSVEDAAGNVGSAACLVNVPKQRFIPAIDNGRNHVVFSNCAYNSPLQSAVATGIENNIIGSSELVNYPNPFDGTTTIQFTLEESSYTKLTVYNSLGIEVATLYDGMADAGHPYTLTFNGNDLAEGVYFYRLQSGESVNTVNKMLLIK